MSRFVSYKLKFRRGIDDLRHVYAFTGASQGDESASNNIEDYDEWMRFNFDCDPADQEAINQESEKRKKDNQAYIQKLKDEGRFGEEYEKIFHFKPFPLFDNK